VSYRDLEIWQEARGLSIDILRMTLEKLPKFEMFARRWVRMIGMRPMTQRFESPYPASGIRYPVSGI
jgi:hypothetical protein